MMRHSDVGFMMSDVGLGSNRHPKSQIRNQRTPQYKSIFYVILRKKTYLKVIFFKNT